MRSLFIKKEQIRMWQMSNWGEKAIAMTSIECFCANFVSFDDD